LINTAQVTPHEDYELPQGCRDPREIVNAHGVTILIGCGQCMVCRRKRRQHWVGRCCLELQQKQVGQFLTLTYDTDADECSYRDVQLWAKRVRRNNPDWPLSYIARGECGEKYGRFHWHVLAFGWNETYCVDLFHMPEWEHGHVFAGDLNARSAAYVYKYTMSDNNWGDTKYSSRPAIGMAGIMRLANALARVQNHNVCPGFFKVGGVKYPISYYMKQKIEDRLVELGCIDIPKQTPDQLFQNVLEFRQHKDSAGAQRAREFARAWNKASTKEIKNLDGQTQRRLHALKPTGPRYTPEHP